MWPSEKDCHRRQTLKQDQPVDMQISAWLKKKNLLIDRINRPTTHLLYQVVHQGEHFGAPSVQVDRLLITNLSGGPENIHNISNSMYKDRSGNLEARAPDQVMIIIVRHAPNLALRPSTGDRLCHHSWGGTLRCVWLRDVTSAW